jgi:hypothetical protein
MDSTEPFDSNRSRELEGYSISNTEKKDPTKKN